MKSLTSFFIMLMFASTSVFANDSSHSKSSHDSGPAVSADQSLGWLKNGNIRYLKGTLRKDGQSPKDRDRLSSAQHPHAIVLSCSDSRVPPEIIFDQKLGEIFTVRVAGEALDSSTIASIEYAVEHLGPQLLVVMGHTQCGAIKAALSTMNGKDAGSNDLNKLVKDIQPRLLEVSRQPASSDYSVEAWANVRAIVTDLSQRSKILKEKLAEGKLKIAPSLYHLDHGNVDWEEQPISRVTKTEIVTH